MFGKERGFSQKLKKEFIFFRPGRSSISAKADILQDVLIH